MGKRLEITQDVFVKVKKAQDVEQLKEPLCPVPDVSLSRSILSSLILQFPRAVPLRVDKRPSFLPDGMI